MSAEVFDRYATYYDLLYRDKDYEAEANYVAQTLRDAEPKTRTLLEFGSGTGRHGRLLAARGFEVLGIERSQSMVDAALSADGNAGFDCREGDVGTTKIGRHFDAVIALFHVMSYQTTEDAIGRAFANASEHLQAGGLFLFDVWHGPAVLEQSVEVRTKRAADSHIKVTRVATPEMRPVEHTVIVRYAILVESISDGTTENFFEEHPMRYFFPDEIASLARDHGFEIERTEEFMSGRPPSKDTWGVCYLLRKNS